MAEFEDLNKIEVNYSTENIPAPFSYQYQVQITLPSHISDVLNIKYSLSYTDREDLEEDEILEEGFSMEDDFEWEGNLPMIWLAELQDLFKKTSWNQKNIPDKNRTSNLHIKLLTKTKEEKESKPANQEQWEYFMQEMTQAIYEISERELPLVVKYKEIDDQKKELMITLQPLFSSRTVAIKVEKEKNSAEEKQIGWNDLKPILKSVYYPDYDYEHALEMVPPKKGKYIDNGEGVWYEFGIGVKNPDKNTDSLERLERSLKELAQN